MNNWGTTPGHFKSKSGNFSASATILPKTTSHSFRCTVCALFFEKVCTFFAAWALVHDGHALRNYFRVYLSRNHADHDVRTKARTRRHGCRAFASPARRKALNLFFRRRRGSPCRLWWSRVDVRKKRFERRPRASRAAAEFDAITNKHGRTTTGDRVESRRSRRTGTAPEGHYRFW